MLQKLKNWYWLNKTRRYLRQCGLTDEQIEHKLVIAQIRSHLKFFGHDVSNLTDKEIEQGAVEFGKLVAGFGVSAKEVIEAFSLANRTLNH